MATWTDEPPQRPAPGIEPRSAWQRLMDALFPPPGPDLPVRPNVDGPCCRVDPGMYLGPCDRSAEAS